MSQPATAIDRFVRKWNQSDYVFATITCATLVVWFKAFQDTLA